MKYPFWMINSTLLFLVMLTFGFIVLSRAKIPAREDIEPHVYSRIKKDQTLKININKIYENDIFDTYQKELSKPEEPETAAIPFPEPPQPQPVTIPEIPQPQFLEPLNVTLKGIIAIHNDSSRNRAIIADNKTNKEATYKMGDMIEDAQLIRIFSNKIIFLRSNGQQEVLYLREQDAKIDPAYASVENWENVAQLLQENTYVINKYEFTSRVSSLAQFIDLLDLITAYKQGKSIGCRIGHITEKSLGAQLGLQTGDIILSVNNIPATNTENRFKIYKDIVAMRDGDTIRVILLRKKQELTMTFTLKEFAPITKEPLRQYEEDGTVTIEKLKEEEKMKAMQDQYKFAPTLQDIRKRERQNMIEKGKAPQTTDER